MTVRRLGIVMYGVTGRMGLNQHLVRSIVAIREQGGVALPNGDSVMPDPILVGRIFSAENWWKKPGEEVLRTCIERFNTAS